MLHHQFARGTSNDEPAPMPRDPRHRPVVLSVAARHARFRHHPATLSVALGFSLLLVSLLTVTLVSAWAGWRVAVSAPERTVVTASPVVPRGTPLEPRGPEVQGLPVPAPAPASAPAPAAELVVAQARTAEGIGVADQPKTIPPVVAETTTPALAQGGLAATDPGRLPVVTVPAADPPAQQHLSASARTATAAPTTSRASDPRPAATPAATSPAATTPAAAAPAATSVGTRGHRDDSSAPGSARSPRGPGAESSDRSASGAQMAGRAPAASEDPRRKDAAPSTQDGSLRSGGHDRAEGRPDHGLGRQSPSARTEEQGHEHRVGAVPVRPQLPVVPPGNAGHLGEQRRHR
ncbi:MAG: hypothetical protein JWP62_1438 [Blastococcus sp.]|nr:hypothetical protein [Blastococcus sp.]